MKPKQRFLSLLLTACLTVGLLPAATAVSADTGAGKAIVPGASHIEGGQADNIYFGTYQQSDKSGKTKDPVKWRVLAKENDKLFLLADQNLDVQKYNEDNKGITWENCTLRTWLNGSCLNPSTLGFYDAAFSEKERGHIAETKNDNANNGSTQGGKSTTDKVFCLSIAEADNNAYFPSGNDSRKGTNTAYVAAGGAFGSDMDEVGVAGPWWLRSPGNYSFNAADVTRDGGVRITGITVVSVYVAVRPAFNLNLDSVLFTSAAEGGKPEGGLKAVEGYSDNDWKLTLKDSGRSFKASKQDDNTITYSGAETGDNEYISVLIADSTGAYTHYGRLAKSRSGNNTVEVILPFDMTGKNLYVFNEQYNGEKMTDYASALQPVDMERNAYAITNNLTNAETNNKVDYRMMTDPSDYTAELAADPDYVLLPENIEVKAGATTLTEGTDYTYVSTDRKKGTLTIPAGKITDDITIIASGTEAKPEVGVSPENHTFTEKHAGYADAPDAQTFIIENKGDQQVTGLSAVLSGRDAGSFTLSTADMDDSIGVGKNTKFTVQPNPGLEAGNYTAIVDIKGDDGVMATASLSFIVSGHVWGEYKSQGTTCTEDGKKVADCTYAGCKAVDEKPEKMFGHDYKKTVTDPTCTKGGYTTYACSRCNHSYVGDETKELGHDFGNWKEITSPSCGGEGQRQRVCGSCSIVETEKITPTGHTWDKDFTVDQQPTCTTDGSKSIHCQKCDAVKDSEVIHKKGHSYTNYVESSAATCTESGKKTADCDNGCGERNVIADDRKPALGHDYSIKGDTVGSTCTEQGYTVYKCSRCAETEKRDLTPANGHNPGVAATCTTDQTCTVCGEVLAEKLGHTGGTATCSAKAACSRCGMEYGDVDLNNHVNTEVRNKKDAAASEDGYTGDIYCNDCNKTVKTGTVIPATGSPATPGRPDEKDPDIPVISETKPVKPDKTAPPTGDESNMWLWFTLAAVSGVLLTGTAAYSRKQKRTNKRNCRHSRGM
ncbi:hypothetical protein DW241_10010 [Hungatella hathewayi]|nr:hypothetical protein DW241_10010 [Hungatella hathewayi]